MHTGDIRWAKPLGEVPDLAAQGVRNTGTHYPKVGPVITASGLLFTGTRDRKVSAFQVETGKLLREFELPAAMEGIPAIYETGGRQFIVFCASAQAGLTPATQKPIRGAYVAFALPAAQGAKASSKLPATPPKAP
jgi:quinoprotein glucose dehydrogenase